MTILQKIEEISSRIKNDSPEIREQAVLELSKIGTEKVLEPLINNLNDPVTEVRSMIIYALGQTKSENAIDTLVECLNSSDFETRWVTVEALGEIDSPKTIAPLIDRLKDELWNVRASAAKALGKYHSGEVIFTLIKCLETEKNSFVRKELYYALNQAGLFEKLQPEPVLSLTQKLQLEPVLTLAQKLHKLLNAGWQNLKIIENQLLEIFPETRDVVSAFRCDLTLEEQINIIRTASIEEVRRNAIGILGEIGVGNREAIDVLSELIDNTIDKETRWQAALNLGIIDPENPKASVRLAKLLDLGTSVEENPLVFSIAQLSTPDRKMEIWLRVQSADRQKSLPSNLRLAILSPSGEQLGTAVETGNNNEELESDRSIVIQKRFSISLGTSIIVEVKLDRFSFTHAINV